MSAIGFDTSCYTTSVAITEGERIIADFRQVLEVEEGGLGLRQSEALFRHIRNIPGLVEAAFKKAGEEGHPVRSIAVSAWPRRVEGSYMPVFSAGVSAAFSAASCLGIAPVEVSHQEGHIAVCAKSCGIGEGDSFLAVHISGGTTEVLDVTWGKRAMGIGLLFGSSDISAGQMIDRIGVKMGLPFPAGPSLERLSEEPGGCGFRIPSSVKDGEISFSGPCEAALRAIGKGIDRGEVARAVLDCIARSISKALLKAASDTGHSKALVAGGVAANNRIRLKLDEELSRSGMEVLFGEKGLSSDNAVGVALLGGLWG